MLPRLEPPLVAGRVRLSSLAPDALTSMAAWLPAALAPEWTPDDLEAVVAGNGGVLISDTERAPIGLAIVLPDRPAAREATLPFLAIEPVRRFRGLGGEAGIALDRHLRDAGFRRVYAPVPDGRGLAVYFWLRLGFRPLSAAQSPGPLIGLTSEPVRGIWMVRDGS